MVALGPPLALISFPPRSSARIRTIFGGRSANGGLSLSIPLDQLISLVGPISKRESITAEMANKATSTRKVHIANPLRVNKDISPMSHLVQPAMLKADVGTFGHSIDRHEIIQWTSG